MLIIPAIDIIGGKVVRLTRGDYGACKEYAVSPAEAAVNFLRTGAERLHVIDLDGAKSGNADNARLIGELAAAAPIEVGGGIRSMRRIEYYLGLGVAAVILGTAAVNDFALVCDAVKNFKGKIAVAVDELNGFVAVDGWRTHTDIDAFDFCVRLRDAGVGNVIYTDISRDGMLGGVNENVYRKLKTIDGLKITSSGGVTSLNDILLLKNIGVDAVVLGKALYEGKIDLQEAVRAAKDI